MQRLKILIPTDFSVQAEYAYLMVKRLELKIPVDIHFVHVMNVPDTVTMDSSGNIQTCGEISIDYVRSQKAIAERNMNQLKTLYGEGIHTEIVLGKLTDKIISYSTEHQFDLIVMGTKGAWGLKEKFSGSETQIIARQSSIPLLSLMCDRSDLVIERVLLVHDFSNPKNDHLKLLHKLIEAFQTKVHLLQIINDGQESKREQMLSDMDTYARVNGIADYEKHLIKDTDVENGVIHFNQMHEMDVVCIGTHGKGGFFHQSATEKLINHLYKPILSYHIQ